MLKMTKINPYKAVSHALTIALSVGISYAVITPKAEYEAKEAMEYAMRCENSLIRGNLEPICAGYLQSIGHEVTTEAMIYSDSPYNAKNAREKVLAQTREIGVKP